MLSEGRPERPTFEREPPLREAFLSGNSLVQTAKARARGYRTTRNLITIAYLISGNLDFELPI